MTEQFYVQAVLEVNGTKAHVATTGLQDMRTLRRLVSIVRTGLASALEPRKRPVGARYYLWEFENGNSVMMSDPEHHWEAEFNGEGLEQHYFGDDPPDEDTVRHAFAKAMAERVELPTVALPVQSVPLDAALGWHWLGNPPSRSASLTVTATRPDLAL